MLTLMNEHTRFEYEHDLEAIMSTISAEPLWEFHPLGMRVEGRDAVRTMYQFEIENLMPNIKSTTKLVGYGKCCVMREATIHANLPGGREAEGFTAIVFEFDASGLVASERIYASGALAELFESCFPPAMWTAPGVTRCTD
jgi:ketosteroid isomerase-like protein